MSRLIRLDRSGHTELARWRSGDAAAEEAAVRAFRRELDQEMLASVSGADGTAEVPLAADRVGVAQKKLVKNSKHKHICKPALFTNL